MVESAVVEPVVMKAVMVEPLAVVEGGVVAVEEPAMVTEEARLMVMPEVPEPVLLEAMGERHVPLGMDESGCGCRTRCREQKPHEEHSCPYRMSQSEAFHRPLPSCLIAQPVIPETSFPVHL